MIRQLSAPNVVNFLDTSCSLAKEIHLRAVALCYHHDLTVIQWWHAGALSIDLFVEDFPTRNIRRP